MCSDEPVRAFQLAAEAEEKAWANVRDKLPGSPNYDPKAWEEWRAAVAATDKARKALAGSLGDDTDL